MIDRALVLAAGFGSRIAGMSATPKPLLAVGGRRLIEWNLVWLAGYGVRDVWVNLHHRPADFRRALGNGERYGLRIRYSQEEEILGTAGGWKRLHAQWDRTALVIYGDNLMRFDLGSLEAAHRAGRVLCTAALYDRARHGNTGIAGGHAVVAADGEITEFLEGTPSDGTAWLVNAGAYVVEPGLVDHIEEGMTDFGRHVLPRLAAGGLLRGHVIDDDGFCLGLDTPEGFARAESMLAAGSVNP